MNFKIFYICVCVYVLVCVVSVSVFVYVYVYGFVYMLPQAKEVNEKYHVVDNAKVKKIYVLCV